MNRPVPTLRAALLFGLGIVPAIAALGTPSLIRWALALDAAALLLVMLDFALAPRARDVELTRAVEPILSAGAMNFVRLRLELLRARRVRGWVRDLAPAQAQVEGNHQAFALEPRAPQVTLRYGVTPPTRGPLAFGDLYLRLLGPLGLCARQQRVAAPVDVKVYPDLVALSRDALALSAVAEPASGRTARRVAEGREFESLREYRPGDDRRTMDWKATARRARPMVRRFEPERNQNILLCLDSGRHMSGKISGRSKLDFAVDAALRLAKVGLDKGDAVGVLAAGAQVRSFLAPRRGPAHLRALTSALYDVRAELEETNFGLALDTAFARVHRRTLVVFLTELQDPQAATALLARVAALRHRHLPMIVSLEDAALGERADAVPRSTDDAYVRHVAGTLRADHRLTVARLRAAGAIVVLAPAHAFSAAAVNAYLGIKARGAL
jgi:uncharacterized protein (DUF58 family)